MSVRNTNHYGIAGYYAMEAAKEDMIGISMTNTTPLVAPANGVERMLGTNPIAVAVPANKQPPMVCDMATSTVAYGKVSSEQMRVTTLSCGCGSHTCTSCRLRLPTAWGHQCPWGGRWTRLASQPNLHQR